MQQTQKRIAAFFYGSFIRKDIMALGGFHPDRIEVGKLNGYDIAFDPHANVFRSSQHAMCYMPPTRGKDAPDLAYLGRILEAAREHGFPSWYIHRLEALRSGAQV